MKKFAASLIGAVALVVLADVMTSLSCDAGEAACWVWTGLAIVSGGLFLAGWTAVIAE